MVKTETFAADAVVIGAGVVGLAVARELSLRGREVLVLEAGRHWPISVLILLAFS